MQGRRLPNRRKSGKPIKLQPGDYQKIGRVWWVCLPTGAMAELHDRETTEHEDGTITVTEPIVWPGKWSGYLEHGVWREV